jgi:radical SAM/Cys-rich protein
MSRALRLENEKLTKSKVEIVQINLGNLCNQACSHCHIDASPSGAKNMDRATAERITAALAASTVLRVEFTGGAPEMNPNMRSMIEGLAKAGKALTVRTNLTVMALPQFAFYMDFFRTHGVALVASLPSLFEDTTDQQRGPGVFATSIFVLRELNNLGYGSDGLLLDLVYNPSGDFLPPPETQLEEEYKELLEERHGIRFNRLFAMVNAPLARFRQKLDRDGAAERYQDLLRRHANPSTIERLMCRNVLSVDYAGHVYDCDFNLAAGIPVRGAENRKLWEFDLDAFRPEVSFAPHCYACTVGLGSSCHGALVENAGGAENDPVVDVRQAVQEYYGQELETTADLKTGACCAADAPPAHIRAVLPLVHDEIKMKYYGCGNAIPERIEGLTILDLGCGTGRDSYVMAKLAGERGFVYGIDMTEAQISVAQKHAHEQARRFGFSRPNTEFIHDLLENADRHIEPGSVDLVTSNCVINLVEDKERVLRGISSALRDGGEFYFSDVYADRRLPDDVRNDRVLYGECLGGALYWKDFVRMTRRTGFPDPRIVSKRMIPITDERIKALIGPATFYSITCRLWKITGLEDACEDYGHVAVYRGGIAEAPFRFVLDSGHVFEKNRPERVCGNTALMLSRTRLAPFFTVTGTFEEHFGAFEDCGTVLRDEGSAQDSGGRCC